MTTYAHDLDGYLLGHRFSDEDKRFWDGEKFLDLSSFKDWDGQNMIASVGTPTIETIGPNNRKAVLLDKTYQARFYPPNLWGGSVVLVYKFEFTGSGTQNRYPYLFGDQVTETSNGFVRFTTFGAQRNVTVGTPASAIQRQNPDNTAGLHVAVWSIDPEARTMSVTNDGVVVDTSPAAASPDTGQGIGLGTFMGAEGCRFGDLIGDGDLVTETDFTIHVAEHHFFSDDIISNQLAKTKDFIDSLKEYYGV